MKIGRTVISAEEIEAKLAEMGAQISKDYAGKDLLLIGILKGAFVVMADLARHIDLPVEFGGNPCGGVLIWSRVGEQAEPKGGFWRRVGIASMLLLFAVVVTR